MYDDLNAPDDRTEPEIGYQPLRRPANGGDGPPGAGPPGAENGRRRSRLPDREVPLPSPAPVALLHQWLDGEVSETAVRATPGGNEAADLWDRIDEEAETLRSRTTPLYVHKRIMESLPEDVHRVKRPWYRQPLTVGPATLLAAAALLVGMGALIARAVFR